MDNKAVRHTPDGNTEDEWDGFCRLCFEEANIMAQLFPDNGCPDRDLLWKILECTTLKLTFDDDFSARICQECINKMTEFCDYRMQCLRNDKKLKARRLRKYTISQIEGIPVEQQAPKHQPVEQIDEHHDDPLDDYDSYYNDAGVEAIEDDDSQQPIVASKLIIKEEVATEHSLSYFRASCGVTDSDHAETTESTDNQRQLQPKKKRTRKILLYEGHTYQLLSSRPKCDSITWGCYWRKSRDCKGTLGTKASGQILGNIIPQHNHPPEPFENKKPKAVIIQAFRDVENVYLDEPYEIVKNRIGGDVLMYEGDRFPYSHSRKDGCRIWKCSSHRNCTVSIYLCPNGKIFKLANSKHADEKIQQKRNRSIESDNSFSDVSANIEEVYPNPVGTFNYKIVKNTNKRNVLIYEGDRYSFYYRKTNGWVVWRCTVSKACHAMIYQLKDESVVVLGETTHNHLKIAYSP